MLLLRRLWPPFVYLALSIVMTWPLARHLGDGLPSGGDALLQAWTIAWNVHALGGGATAVWDAPIFYPYPDTLAYTDNHLLIAILTAPITWLSGEPLLAHNLLVLLSFSLSGWAVYLLARDTLPRTVGPWPALLAGAAFTFCAYRFAHLSQLNLLQTAWMIFALRHLRRLLLPFEQGGGRLADALLSGLFAGIQVATALYYAFFTAALLGGYGLLWAGGALWARLRLGRPLPWRQAGLTLLAALLAVLLALPFTLPYVRVYGSLGIVRSVRELDGWSAPLQAYFSVPAENLLYGRLGEAVVGSGELVLFPGLLVAGLAIVGSGLLVTARLGRRSWSVGLPGWLDASYWLLVAASAFLLSFGTGLRLLRVDAPLSLPLPYLLLYTRLPGFAALRVPARWGLLVCLALVLLAALALAVLFARLRPRTRMWVGSVLLAGVLVEQAAPPSILAGLSASSAPAPVYAWLAEPAQADIGPLLELPITAAPRGAMLEQVIARQWQQRLHWHPLVAAYSGLQPFGTSDLLRRAEDLPAEEHLAFLRMAGVGALVVHSDEFDPAARTALLAGLDRSPQVQRRAQLGAALVYTLLPDPHLVLIEQAAGPGGTILLSADERVPGVLALALVQRLSQAGHPLYGLARPRFYPALLPVRPGQVFAAGLLAEGEDPQRYGFAPADQIWQHAGLALYRRNPALLASLELAEAVPDQFHPRFPTRLELEATAEGLWVGDLKLVAPTTSGLQIELDVAALVSDELDLGGMRVVVPAGLSQVRFSLPEGTDLSLVGSEERSALLRLRLLAAPPAEAVVTPTPGLVLTAAAAFDGHELLVRARGAGATHLELLIIGAAAYDDRPVKLVAGLLELPQGGEAVDFRLDPLHPDGSWIHTSNEPVDGRYSVYLRDADGSAYPGTPVATFRLLGGQLVEFKAAPLPLGGAR